MSTWKKLVTTGFGIIRRLSVGLACVAVPASCFAQTIGQAQLIPVGDISLFPLPNNTMAAVKGTGFQGPALNRSAAPAGTIILWDELKPLAQQQNVVNGTQIITINGVPQ